MNHKGTVTLETERLILRRFCLQDADAMFRNLHTKVGDTVEAVCDFFRTNWLDAYVSANSYQWVVVLKSLGEPVGTLRAELVGDARRSLELGAEIGDKWWHNGYMTEAVKRVIKFFFEEVGMNRIAARHNATNPRSGGVMLNAHMTIEGVQRQASRTGCDVIMYAILADDYFGKNKANVSIVPYERKYHDDMLFCFLAAKDAIGAYAPDTQWSKPALRNDLLDIESNYFGRGDVFYLAIDDRDRVIGMIGTQTTSSAELWLKRLFIKPELKGKGIGSKLLSTVEDYAAGKGITEIHTRFAYWYREAAFFYPAKGFLEVERNDYLVHMMKRLK